MSEENCNHECGSCGEECSSRQEAFDFHVDLHPLSTVGHVIGVVSGKGGVGKSLVTSMLAVQMQRRGCQTAILDADVTGPSIPKMFGLNMLAHSDDKGLRPVQARSGVDVMSLNLLVKDATEPVIWRGPAIADIVKQFWSKVIWSGEEYMFVDMPPGTGDVPLTVFQSLPVDGIIIVSSPQELVSMIVEKAVRMAEMMNVPILGVVENMSYVKCPDCGKEIELFGKSRVAETAKKHGLKVLARIPVDPRIAELCDAGDIEKCRAEWLDEAADMLEKMADKPEAKGDGSVKDMKIAVTEEDGQIYQHFGHTRWFEVYDIKDGQIASHEKIDAQGSGHEALGGFLKAHGVDLLICGGIGAGAMEVLEDAGIGLVYGAEGSVEEAVKAYLAGKLQNDPSGECHEHDHNHGEVEGQCHGCGHDGEGHSCH